MKKMPLAMRLMLTFIFVFLTGCQSTAFSELDDIAALRALDKAYAEQWKAGNADGVMALFTQDATLVPHHGDAPIIGHTAIREFWFNPKYPPTVIPAWDRDPKEFIVSGNIGIVRGRARLVWVYNRVRTTIPEGNYVLIAERQDKGWQIRMLTWNDDPRKWIQEHLN